MLQLIISFEVKCAYLYFYRSFLIHCGCLYIQYIEPAIIVSCCVVWMNHNSQGSRSYSLDGKSHPIVPTQSKIFFLVFFCCHISLKSIMHKRSVEFNIQIAETNLDTFFNWLMPCSQTSPGPGPYTQTWTMTPNSTVYFSPDTLRIFLASIVIIDMCLI